MLGHFHTQIDWSLIFLNLLIFKEILSTLSLPEANITTDFSDSNSWDQSPSALSHVTGFCLCTLCSHALLNNRDIF